MKKRILSLLILLSAATATMAYNSILAKLVKTDYEGKADSLTKVFIKEFMNTSKGTFWVTPKTFKVKRLQISAVPEPVEGSIRHFDKLSDQTVIINYDNFQEINGKLLPTKIILDASDIFDLNIEIDYSEIKVGEKLEFPFNISKKYSRI